MFDGAVLGHKMAYRKLLQLFQCAVLVVPTGVRTKEKFVSAFLVIYVALTFKCLQEACTCPKREDCVDLT